MWFECVSCCCSSVSIRASWSSGRIDRQWDTYGAVNLDVIDRINPADLLREYLRVILNRHVSLSLRLILWMDAIIFATFFFGYFLVSNVFGYFLENHEGSFFFFVFFSMTWKFQVNCSIIKERVSYSLYFLYISSNFFVLSTFRTFSDIFSKITKEAFFCIFFSITWEVSGQLQYYQRELQYYQRESVVFFIFSLYSLTSSSLSTFRTFWSLFFCIFFHDGQLQSYQRQSIIFWIDIIIIIRFCAKQRPLFFASLTVSKRENKKPKDLFEKDEI